MMNRRQFLFASSAAALAAALPADATGAAVFGQIGPGGPVGPPGAAALPGEWMIMVNAAKPVRFLPEVKFAAFQSLQQAVDFATRLDNPGTIYVGEGTYHLEASKPLKMPFTQPIRGEPFDG